MGRRGNREQIEETWAADAERRGEEPLPGHGRIVREGATPPAVAGSRPPGVHLDADGNETLPYRQIGRPVAGQPLHNLQGIPLDVPAPPAHQVGAPPPRQGANNPSGHGDPRMNPNSLNHPPIYRIEASTSNPSHSGGRAVPAAQGHMTMSERAQQGGVVRVGGQPIQQNQSHMHARVQAVAGEVTPSQAAVLLAQQSGTAQGQSSFQGRSHQPGRAQGVSVSVRGGQQQPQQPAPLPGLQGIPGASEILQENSQVTIAMADEATVRRELEAAGLQHRIPRPATTVQRRVDVSQLAAAPRLDVTVILSAFNRPGLLKTQIAALRQSTKLPQNVIVLVGAGVAVGDALSDGHPWAEGALPHNLYGLPISPWERFSVATRVPTKYVAVLDDDCMPGPGWLEACVDAMEHGLEAVIAAAGYRLDAEGAEVGYVGPATDSAGNVIEVSQDTRRGGRLCDPEDACVVDIGKSGWFLMRKWMGALAQPGPLGETPYGWQVHLSALAMLEFQVPTVVLPYDVERKQWGDSTPSLNDGLQNLQGIKTLRLRVFEEYQEAGWKILADQEDAWNGIPVPSEESELEGAYFSPLLDRTVQPGDPEWSAEHYTLVTGKAWAGDGVVTAAFDRDGVEITMPLQPDTSSGGEVGADTVVMVVRDMDLEESSQLVREAEADEESDLALTEEEPEPPAPVPHVAETYPFHVDLDVGKHAWCACGLSKAQPFCDGSHKDTTFQPLVFRHEKRAKVMLCQCKATKNPPYCDGSHVAIAAAQAEVTAAAERIADAIADAAAEVFES